MADIELTLIAETKDDSGENDDTKPSFSPEPAPTEVDPLAFDTEVASYPLEADVAKTENTVELNDGMKPKTSDSEASCDESAGDTKDQGNCQTLKPYEGLPTTLNSDESNAADKLETIDQASSSSEGAFTIFVEKKKKTNEEQKQDANEITEMEKKTKDVSEELPEKYNKCEVHETDHVKSVREENLNGVDLSSKSQTTSATNLIDPDIIEVDNSIKTQVDEEKGNSRNTREEKKEPRYEHLNGKHVKNETKNKRPIEDDAQPLSPTKKLCQEIESAYPRHDTVINDYIQTATNNNVPEMQQHTEQLLGEIQTLRDLAQKKEQEWNNILHLKKIKEEILLRLLRKKQVLSFEKATLETEKNPHNLSHSNCMNLEYLPTSPKGYTIDRNDEISGVAMKPTFQTSQMNNNLNSIPIGPHFWPPLYERNLSQGTAKSNHAKSAPKLNAPIAPKRQPNIQMPNFFHHIAKSLDQAPMGRQGPIKDVKSIIADYRQNHPEAIPRRGRRQGKDLDKNGAASKSSIPKDSRLSDLSLFLSSMNVQNQKSILEQISEIQASSPNAVSFKDVLVKIASMQAHPAGAGRVPSAPRLPPAPPVAPPPPYPEISLHPVSASPTQQEAQNTSSLLHGILTKQQLQGAGRASSAFSPTLARLLTAPEKTHPYTQVKNCGEITITPLNPSSSHNNALNLSMIDNNIVQLDEEDPSEAEEGEGSSSAAENEERLVIDEDGGGEGAGEAGEGVTPRCQGCHTRDAKFVCAGCANQWYCSRQCQVAAWDDHSEMCS